MKKTKLYCTDEEEEKEWEPNEATDEELEESEKWGEKWSETEEKYEGEEK